MDEQPIIPIETARELIGPDGNLILMWVLKHHSPVNFPQLYQLIAGKVFIKSERDYGSGGGHGEDSIETEIESLLRELVKCGLVELQQSDPNDILYSISPHIERLLHIFRLMSLDDQIKLQTEGNIVVRPIFGLPRTDHPRAVSKKVQVLAIIPPSKTSEEHYTNSIKRLTYTLNIKCERTKDLFSNNSLLGKNWSALFHAQICIADCTGRDPNIFYALGIAHTIGKKCILISQSLEDIPLNLRQSPVIIYDQSPESLTQFEQTLSDLLSTEFDLKSR